MTKPRPRNPRNIWATLKVTWTPRPGAPGDPPPVEQTYYIALVNRGATNWHAYESEPPAVLTHVIDLQTETTATEAFIDPPSDDYEPLASIDPAQQTVANWTPYEVPAAPIITAPGTTAATIAFTEGHPLRNIPAPIAAMPGITGTLGPIVIENRQRGPNARSRALTCARPGAGQQQLNARFARSAAFWQSLTPTDRENWTTAARLKAPQLSGYAYYLGFALTFRAETVAGLERQLGFSLPLPPQTE